MTRQEAIETIKVAFDQVEWKYQMDFMVAFRMAIEALKTDVVRCRDCKYYVSASGYEAKYCYKHPAMLGISDDWFCAGAEKP